MSYQCVVCKSNKKLNVCSACKAVHYCGVEHQKEHWKSHKALCTKAKAAATSGFVKDITKEGEGPLAKGTVTVHYTGTLLDGTKFDSSRDRADPFSFRLGAGEVIRGWDEGVATMKVGERAIFVLSASYGYGAHGSPPDIPPQAPLVFDVEVLACSK